MSEAFVNPRKSKHDVVMSQKTHGKVVYQLRRQINLQDAALRWLTSHVSNAELHRLGLIESPNDTVDSVDDLVERVMLQGQALLASEERLTGKQVEESKQLLLTDHEFTRVASMRMQGISGEDIAAEILKARGVTP